MISKRLVATLTLSLALAAASFPRAASSQLPSASTAALGTANNYTALARGFSAIALNPAGLAMAGNPGFSLTFLPLQAQAGLNAIALADVAAFDGMKIPPTTKEEWLQSVTTECSIEIEMSGLVEVEMSSFGVCSFGVERANGTGGGDADIEPARSRPTGGTEAGGAGTSSGQARGGVAGHNLTPLPQATQEMGASRRRSGDPWASRPTLESGQGVADAGPSVEAGA